MNDTTGQPIGTEQPIGIEELPEQLSITDRARESIREAIIDGRLAPGSLHSVQTLADSFKVSRTPVREALIDLAGLGMVEFERNRGVRILETSVHDLEQIFALRLLLEVPATHRAVAHRGADLAVELAAPLEAMRIAIEADDERTMMRNDRIYHRVINEASGNFRLAAYVDSLRDLVLTRGVSTVGRSRALDDILAEHIEIQDAVAAGDASAATAAMKRHIVNTATLLLAQEGGRDAARGLDWAELVPG